MPSYYIPAFDRRLEAIDLVCRSTTKAFELRSPFVVGVKRKKLNNTLL